MQLLLKKNQHRNTDGGKLLGLEKFGNLAGDKIILDDLNLIKNSLLF